MPTELKLECSIKGVTAKDYYRVVYSDDSCIRRFHNKVNNDPSSECTAWQMLNRFSFQRTVTFHMPLNVPAMIKKIIGSDSLRVIETCKLEWKGTESFVIISEPILDFPGANKFTTSGSTLVSNTSDGCHIVCSMTAAAGLPWPMQGSVEAIMAQEGKATIGRYLDFTKAACEEDGDKGGSKQPPKAQRVQPRTRARATEDEDVFLSAAEEEEEEEISVAQPTPLRGSRKARRERLEPESSDLVAYESIGKDEAALRCLLSIQQSLHRIDTNIAAIRAAVTKKPRVSRATDAPNSTSNTWAYVLCFGLAGASAASVIYLRALRRSSES
jgi:hypothetical protein